MDSPDQDNTEKRRGNEAGVGALLKASRLRVGGDLHQIADTLRIRYVYMEAIEDGRYDVLPGPTYATGFIRAYAEHLGLDSQEVVRRLKSETAGGRDTTDLVFPEPIPESGVPGGAVVLVGILVAAVAYGAWYINSSKDGFLVELISPLPDRLAKLVDGDGKPKEQAAPAATTEQAKPAAKAEAAPADKQETKPEAKAEPQPAPAEVKPEATPDTKPAIPEAKPEAKVETAAAPAPVSSPASPAPAAQPEAASAPATQPAASATAAAPSAGEPRQTPESRETPVATERPAPAGPVEPSIAGANVPVDMIPPPKPAATSAAITPATTPATPAATPAAAAPPAPSPAGPPAAAEPTPQPAPTPATATAATAAAATPATESAPAATTPATAMTAAATPASTPGADEAKSRILVRAKLNSWIQVRDDAGGELLVTRLLRSGDSYAVPDRPGLRLSTGNAGALEILVDGQAVPAIGEDGTVRRNVRLDAEKLKAGQAVAE